MAVPALRKVHGAIKAIDGFVKARDRSSKDGFLIGNELSIADIAAGAMLGMMDMVETQFGLIKWKEEYPELLKWWEKLLIKWKEEYPELLEWWEKLEERESFRETRPVMFDLKEKVA